MQNALRAAKGDGGSVAGGERVLQDAYTSAYCVRPTIVEIPAQTDTVRRESFALILLHAQVRRLRRGAALAQRVRQGLSSAIFSNDLRGTETLGAYF
jgi:aldehyde dehydrogenase (NAD+)